MVEMNTTNTSKNDLLQREELAIEIQSHSNPTEAEIKEYVGKPEELVVIKKIKNNFGKHKFTAEVFVYESEEARKKNETIPQKIRKKMEAEAKAKAEEEKNKSQEEAKAKEEAEKAEAPVEESKEEEKPAEEENKEEKAE